MFTKFRLTLSTLHNWHIKERESPAPVLQYVYIPILVDLCHHIDKYLYNVMLLGKMGIGYVLDGYTGVWDNDHIII